MSDDDVCGERRALCERQSAALLLGPLRPSAHTCAHGVERTLDDLFPASVPAGEETTA